MIERYLRELKERLPLALGARVRVLAEARSHLQDAAAADGEEEAVRAFGDVDLVAAQLLPELRERAIRRAAWLAPFLVAIFVVPFYLVPENEFPPATWQAMPSYLAWKQDAALIAFVVAAAAALVGAGIATLSARAATAVLLLSGASLVAAAVIASVMDAQWIDEVPGTSAALVYGAVIPGRLAVVVALLTVFASALLGYGRRELPSD